MEGRGTALALAVVLLVACGGATSRASTVSLKPSTGQASASPSPAPQASPSSAPLPALVAAPTPTPTPAHPPVTAVNCTGSNPNSDPVVEVGGGFGQVNIYDVAAPLAPRRLCVITDASHVRLLSNRSIEFVGSDGSGSWKIERQTFGSPPTAVAPAPGGPYQVTWGPNGEVAYEKGIEDPSGQCCGTTEIHLVTDGSDRTVCNYQVGIVGIGPARFFPTRIFDFSSDGHYFVATPLFGRGGKGCPVFVKSSDGTTAASLPDGTNSGFWSNHGRVLYLQTPGGTQEWTPVGGFESLTSAAWIEPSESADGKRVAFTYYKSPSGDDADLRVGVLDVAAGASPNLPDRPRAQAGFVTPSVIWYLEEGLCADASNCLGTMAPTGTVLAFDLTTRAESPVIFAGGEAPITKQDYGGFGTSVAPAG